MKKGPTRMIQIVTPKSRVSLPLYVYFAIINQSLLCIFTIYHFALQDKVGDFARLNNKGLLDSTIDAVGNTGLKVLGIFVIVIKVKK